MESRKKLIDYMWVWWILLLPVVFIVLFYLLKPTY